jgi:hypothetical protein
VRPERLDHAPATSPPARADGSWLAAGVQQGHLHGSVLAPDRGLTSADQRLERAVLAHLAECARAAGRERMSRFPVGMYGRASRNGQRLRGTPLPVRGSPVCVYGGQAAGTAFHYGSPPNGHPFYPLVRRTTHLTPPLAGVVTGASMSIVADEIMTATFGFCAPNRDYPVSTHISRFRCSPSVRARRRLHSGSRLGARPASAITASTGNRSRLFDPRHVAAARTVGQSSRRC